MNLGSASLHGSPIYAKTQKQNAPWSICGDDEKGLNGTKLSSRPGCMKYVTNT